MISLHGTLAVLLLATACGSQPEPVVDSGVARAALEAYLLSWNARDTSALSRALAPSMVYHYLGKDIPGDLAAHLKYLKQFGSGFPDLQATVDVFTASGDLGAAVTTWTGTNTGVLCKAPASGKKATWVVNYVFRISGGKIVELWEAWDEGGLYAQLGVDASKCE